MNKLVFTVVVAVATFAIASAAPGVSTKVVDWDAVQAKVNEIADTVTSTTDSVVNAANNENAAVGSSIRTKIDAGLVDAKAALAQANAAIAAQTLTATEARQLVSSVKGSIGKLIGSIEAELAQLTPVNAVAIRAQLRGLFDQVELQAQQLYVLLGQ